MCILAGEAAVRGGAAANTQTWRITRVCGWRLERDTDRRERAPHATARDTTRRYIVCIESETCVGRERECGVMIMLDIRPCCMVRERCSGFKLSSCDQFRVILLSDNEQLSPDCLHPGA